MASCCGGAHRVMYKKDVNGKTVRVEVEEENMPKVAVEFVGFRVGGFTVYGQATKTAYRFSSFDRVKEVYEEDVESILQQKNGQEFRRVGAAPSVIERPRRGMPPNIDLPIGNSIRQGQAVLSDAERAARAAVATRAQQPSLLPKEGVAADNNIKRGPGRPRKDETIQQQPQRMKPMRDIHGTTRVDPKQFGL